MTPRELSLRTPNIENIESFLKEYKPFNEEDIDVENELLRLVNLGRIESIEAKVGNTYVSVQVSVQLAKDGGFEDIHSMCKKTGVTTHPSPTATGAQVHRFGERLQYLVQLQSSVYHVEQKR